MESKKRPHADDGEHSWAKERAVSDEYASPSHPNGAPTLQVDKPKERDNIVGGFSLIPGDAAVP